MKTYIFGYGSLINQESRKLSTSELSPAIPVKVHGLTRGWFARTEITSLSTTFLGCLESDSPFLETIECPDSTNGVLYEIHHDELSKLDQREKNYEKKRLDPQQIRFYDYGINEPYIVYTYRNKFENIEELMDSKPNKNFPIVQSYVDICINGCFEIEELSKEAKEDSFLESFLTETIFWSSFWANDRIMPRRAHMYEPNADKIDVVLEKHFPDFFNKIYIE